MSIAVGARLGRYEIRSLLGAGGMGEVYLAQDTMLERNVALKVLPADLAANENRMQRFIREAKAASALNHPNILTIHEIGQQDEHHFIATEYIEGESLRQHITRSRMGLRETLDVISQVASALAAAHQAGIIHRDIKPENIMVRRDGLIKVLDFGLAKLVATTPQEDKDAEAPTMTKVVKTDPGIVMGTANYMSPEQARGMEVDARSDLWSLGVVLYEMVAGRLPFEGKTTSDVIATILHHEPPSLLLYRPNMPAEVERIVEKTLTKDVEERYQLAKELNVDLKRLKQHLEIEAELERSITPEEGARRAGVPTATDGRAPTISGTTKAAAAQTAEGSTTRTISSAEYIVHEIKQHKRGALVVLATLVLAVGAIFAYVSYSNTRAQAISSVAVLPFANVSGDPNMEYLSDGISESLINALSQLPQLKVIARSSAFKYKGKEVDPQETAKALGVQAIVTGRVMDPKEALPKARAAAQKALELDETLAEAHVALGLVMLDEWDWAGAEREFKRATELNSNLADAYFRYTSYLSFMGRHTEALAKIKRAQELDPLRIQLRGQEGNALYFARRYDEAIQQLQSVIKLEPDYGFAHVVLGYAYAIKGVQREAISEYQKQISIDGETTSTQCYLGYALAMSGKKGEAHAILDKLKSTKQYVSPAEFAILYAGLGDKDGAIASLEKAYAAHDLQMQALKVDPHYDSLRSDPRFIELMRKVGLPS